MPMPPNVTEMLTDAELERLRKAFREAAYPGIDPATVTTADARFGMFVQSTLVARFPPARDYVAAIGNHFYDDSPDLGPQIRERVVIACLLAHANDGGFYLSVHLYWALMVGLSVQQVAWVIVLCSSYSGIDRYSLGLTLLTEAQGALKAQLALTDEANIAPGAVLGALQASFAARH